MSESIKYSLIVTCYYEEQSVNEFYTRAKAVLDSVGAPYEMIFINDGSTDATYERLCQIYEADENVSRIIDFTRNYGQGAAATAGVEFASGENVIYLDSDLQLDPEDIPKLIEMREKGFVLVRGFREERKDSLSRRVCSWMVNRISARQDKIIDLGATYMLIARTVLDQFEFNRWNLWTKVDFFKHFSDIAEVPVNHHERRYGKSGQKFFKLWDFNMHLLINSAKFLFQYIALVALILSSLFFVRVIVSFVSSGKILPNISNGLIINSLVIVFFILLCVLCVVGEFSVRTYMKSQRNPAYIIREMRSRDMKNEAR